MKRSAFAMLGILITLLVAVGLLMISLKFFSGYSVKSGQSYNTQKQVVDEKLDELQKSINKSRELNYNYVNEEK